MPFPAQFHRADGEAEPCGERASHRAPGGTRHGPPPHDSPGPRGRSLRDPGRPRARRKGSAGLSVPPAASPAPRPPPGGAPRPRWVYLSSRRGGASCGSPGPAPSPSRSAPPRTAPARSARRALPRRCNAAHGRDGPGWAGPAGTRDRRRPPTEHGAPWGPARPQPGGGGQDVDVLGLPR